MTRNAVRCVDDELVGRKLDAVPRLILGQNPRAIDLVEDDAREIHRHQIDGAKLTGCDVPDDFSDRDVAPDRQRQVLQNLIERIETRKNTPTVSRGFVSRSPVDPLDLVDRTTHLPLQTRQGKPARIRDRIEMGVFLLHLLEQLHRSRQRAVIRLSENRKQSRGCQPGTGIITNGILAPREYDLPHPGTVTTIRA